MNKQYAFNQIMEENAVELQVNQINMECECDNLFDKGVSYQLKSKTLHSKVLLGDGVPYGYQYKKYQLVVDPAEGIILATIITLAKEGRSLREICTLLNNQGIKTRKGTNWNDANINRIVKLTIGGRGEYITKSTMNKENSLINKESNRMHVDNEMTAAYLRTSSYSKKDYRINVFDGIKFYEDRGYSGLSDPFTRPAMAALLEDVQNGKVKEVIFLELRSISRIEKDFLKIIEILQKSSVKLTYLGK